MAAVREPVLDENALNIFTDGSSYSSPRRGGFELFVCTHDLLASGLDENVYANRLQLVTAGDRGTAGVAPNART
jgi:hypothetical protein